MTANQAGYTFTVAVPADSKPCVALITGYDRKYRLARTFLDASQITARDDGSRAYEYLLDDGFYATDVNGSRGYFAILGADSFPLDGSDLSRAIKRAHTSGISVSKLLEEYRQVVSKRAVKLDALVTALAKALTPKQPRPSRPPIETVTARDVFDGSDSVLTRRYLVALEGKGSFGRIAANLFRAQKASTRAKLYRGGLQTVSYGDLAYRHKGEGLETLCELLMESSATGIFWGWGIDDAQGYACYVLYVDLPQGQVSFHSPDRFRGPTYQEEWDGTGLSEDRILQFCDAVMQDRFN